MDTSHPTLKRAPSRNLLVLFTVLLMLLVFVRDATILRAFGYVFTGDSGVYITFQSVSRTAPYPLMNFLVASATNPAAIIWLQIVITALAVGAIVYTIGKLDWILAVGVGILLLLDFNWAANSKVIGTEAPFTSFWILSLACLVNHFQRRNSLTRTTLALAGALYAWAAFLRPTTFYLVIPLVLLYLWFTHSWRKTAWVAGGAAVVIGCFAVFSITQNGQFKVIGGTGAYNALALFYHHLYSPNNGPVSQELSRALQNCPPNYEALDDYVSHTMSACLGQAGWNDDVIADKVNKAYLESITHDPAGYALLMTRKTASYLAYPTGRVVLQGFLWNGNSVCQAYSWCAKEIADGQQYPELQTAVNNVIDTFTRATVFLVQVHLALLALISGTGIQAVYSALWPQQTILPAIVANYSLLIIGAWVVLIGFLLLSSRSWARLLVVGCTLLICAVLLSSSIANGTLQGRFVMVLSPFYGILSLLAVKNIVVLTFKFLGVRIGTRMIPLRSR